MHDFSPDRANCRRNAGPLCSEKDHYRNIDVRNGKSRGAPATRQEIRQASPRCNATPAMTRPMPASSPGDGICRKVEGGADRSARGRTKLARFRRAHGELIADLGDHRGHMVVDRSRLSWGFRARSRRRNVTAALAIAGALSPVNRQADPTPPPRARRTQGSLARSRGSGR
jgi:hypothetical protein